MSDANPYRAPADASSANGRNDLPGIQLRSLIAGVPILGLCSGMSFAFVCPLVVANKPPFFAAFLTLATGVIVVISMLLCLILLPVLVRSNRAGRLTRNSAFKILIGFGAAVIIVLCFACCVRVIGSKLSYSTQELTEVLTISLICWSAGSAAFAWWIGRIRRKMPGPLLNSG